ncbi:hypothetical protein BDV98DRAFT_114223 [Pterulicium gracile]|uniref:F-box domain-containing protein n=1 Tax=Pterulicium gracile TaxID=1884261 RepID=A0A5C3QJH6_9AGAR|nr:hypothetical protein BDV98DRAFT_114223 [Pterula gracilis]
MLELPPELWSKIFEELPEKLASRLYAVNSIFLEHALNLRYRELDVLFSPRSNNISSEGCQAEDQTLRHRVRYLQLCEEAHKVSCPFGKQEETRDLKMYIRTLNQAMQVAGSLATRMLY